MFAITELNRNTRRAICLVLAALVVSASLLIGAMGAESLEHPGYSVTISEIV